MQHALYSRWLDEALGSTGLAWPDNPASTCASCAMAHRGPGVHFRADVKCCMFYPRLPNFLVGGLLSAQGPGFLALRAQDLRPWGLERPAARGEALHQANQQGRFGLDPALLCPHYSEGLCGIWSHREAVCATWFCKPTRARVGRALWNDLARLLSAVEEQLARDCCAALGLDPAGGFGAWQPEDFYLRCAARVEGMSWRQILDQGGFTLRFRLREVRASLRALHDPTLPEVLVWAPRALHPLPGGGARAEGYGPYDPVDLDAATLERLPRFDGRPVAEVLAELGADAPEPELLRALTEHALLRPAEGTGT